MSALASSRAGPSTPIRATPSSLASKAAPAVPPASQAYEPLVKGVLRHRLVFKIFLYSAVFSWSSIGFISVWRRGGTAAVGLVNTFLVPFVPATIAFTLATWLFGVAPIVVVRKVFLTGMSIIASHVSELTRVYRSLQLAQRRHCPPRACFTWR